MKFKTIKNDSSQIEYLQMPRFLFEIEELSPNAKIAYMFIYDRVRQGRGKESFTTSKGDSFCYYSDDELAQQMKVSRATAQRAVAELKEHDLLAREKKTMKSVITLLSVPCESIKNEALESIKYEATKASDMKLSKASDMRLSHHYIYKEQNSKNKEQEQELVFASEKTKKQSEKKTKKKAKDAAEDKRAKEVTREIIEHWNENYQTKYSPTTKVTVDLVKALLKNKYKPNQILQVIDYKAKSRKTEEDYRWFVPSTVLRLKNFERNRQFMGNEQKAKEGKTQASQSYKSRNKIPDSVTLPDWYEVKESEQATTDDVQKILELQNQILKGEQQ